MIDVDPVLRFANLERSADQAPRHRVPVSMDVDITFDINETVMQRVDLRDEQRQGLEMGPFRGEELPRAPMQMALYVAFTLSHHARAWALRSEKSANRRPARKLPSMKLIGICDASHIPLSAKRIDMRSEGRQ